MALSVSEMNCSMNSLLDGPISEAEMCSVISMSHIYECKMRCELSIESTALCMWD